MAQAIQSVLDGKPSNAARPAVPPPSGFQSQAVFSGAARQQISDHRFADADTNMDIRPRPATPANQTLPGQVTGILSRFTPRPIRPVSAVFVSLILMTVVNLMASIAGTIADTRRLRLRLGLRSLPGRRPAGLHRLGHAIALAADSGHHRLRARPAAGLLVPDRALGRLGLPMDAHPAHRRSRHLPAHPPE
jgi:hypothetical protein